MNEERSLKHFWNGVLLEEKEEEEEEIPVAKSQFKFRPQKILFKFEMFHFRI